MLFVFLGTILSAAIIPNHSLFCFLFKERKLLELKAFYALYLIMREGKHWGLANIGDKAYSMSRNSHIFIKGKNLRFYKRYGSFLEGGKGRMAWHILTKNITGFSYYNDQLFKNKNKKQKNKKYTFFSFKLTFLLIKVLFKLSFTVLKINNSFFKRTILLLINF